MPELVDGQLLGLDGHVPKADGDWAGMNGIFHCQILPERWKFVGQKCTILPKSA
jgi:hypothetical protein